MAKSNNLPTEMAKAKKRNMIKLMPRSVLIPE